MKYESLRGTYYQEIKSDTLYLSYFYEKARKKNPRRWRKVLRHQVVSSYHENFDFEARFTDRMGNLLFVWYFRCGTPRDEMLEVAKNLVDLINMGEN
jgi:hypothetical protein